MPKDKATISKEELRQLAETLAVFQKLPAMDQIAIQYYIKGRLDAIAAEIEIPIKAAV